MLRLPVFWSRGWVLILLALSARALHLVSATDDDSIPAEFLPHIRRLENGLEMVDVVVGIKSEDDPPEVLGETIAEFERSTAKVIRTTPSELLSLQKNSKVSFVEPDALNHMHIQPPLEKFEAAKKPDSAERRKLSPALDQIQASDPRIPRNATDCTVKVCIVDSGALISHPDLALTYPRVAGISFVDASWDNPIATADHGSHIAGIIFGNGQVQGVAPHACLRIARVFGDEPNPIAPTSLTNRAIEWCADEGSKIINLSYGTTVYSNNSAAILSRLRSEGVLVVASAGNSGHAGYSYPASYPDVISVANLDSDNERYRSSQYNREVDLSAPGVDVNSTVPTFGMHDESGRKFTVEYMEHSGIITEPLTASPVMCSGTNVCSQAANSICLIETLDYGRFYEQQLLACQAGGGLAAVLHGNPSQKEIPPQHLDSQTLVEIPVLKTNMIDGFMASTAASLTMDLQVPGYDTKIGTSMAAPHVAGVAALIWSAVPSCTNEDVRTALEVTARDLGLPGRDNFYGHGLVQAYDAYEHLSRMPCATAASVSTTSVPEETPTDGDEAPPFEVIIPYAPPEQERQKNKYLREVNGRRDRAGLVRR